MAAEAIATRAAASILRVAQREDLTARVAGSTVLTLADRSGEPTMAAKGGALCEEIESFDGGCWTARDEGEESGEGDREQQLSVVA
jgi:hypothetical protein